VPSAEADPLLPDRFQSWFAARAGRRVSISLRCWQKPGGPLDVLIAPTAPARRWRDFCQLWSSFLLRRRLWGEVKRKACSPLAAA